MTDTDHDRECPACDAKTLGEWDPVLLVYHCPTCSTTWRRRPGRRVPPYTRKLPGTVAPIDPTRSELPDEHEQ